MNKTTQKLNKRGFLAIAFGLLFVIFTTIWIFNSVDYASSVDDMISKEYTFESYKYRKNWGRYGEQYYKIYVREESQPLALVPKNLTEDGREIVEALTSGDVISCRVIETTRDGHTYEITEMSHNGKCVVLLDEYIENRYESQFIGYCLFGGVGLFFITLGVIVLFNIDKRVKILRRLLNT